MENKTLLWVADWHAHEVKRLASVNVQNKRLKSRMATHQIMEVKMRHFATLSDEELEAEINVHTQR